MGLLEFLTALACKCVRLHVWPSICVIHTQASICRQLWLKLHRGHGAWSSNGDLVAGTLEAGAHWSEVEEDDTGLKRPKWRRV